MTMASVTLLGQQTEAGARQSHRESQVFSDRREQPHSTFAVPPHRPTACLDGKRVIRHSKTRNPNPQESVHTGCSWVGFFRSFRYCEMRFCNILSLPHLLLSHSLFLPVLQKCTFLQVSSNSRFVESNRLQSICLPAGSHCQLRQQQVPERWMGQWP